MSDSVDKLDAEWRREENRKLRNALLIHNRLSVVVLTDEPAAILSPVGLKITALGCCG
jgi:hypothetical protein